MSYLVVILCFFFFQAEDGIRDFHVTGVQTCALPILANRAATAQQQARWLAAKLSDALAEQQDLLASLQQKQSEIRGGISQAKSLYESLNRQYHDALAAQRAASASAYS